MAITQYEKDGKALWQVYVNLRSSDNTSIRVQKRVLDLKSESAAIAEEKRVIKLLSQELLRKVGRVLEIGLKPEEWYDESHRFYDYFYEKRFSYSYITKIRYVLNQWGFFLSRKLGTAFYPIPRPQGYEKRRLLDGYFEKLERKGISHRSDPITPERLKGARRRFKVDHYNWLYLSVWLGLRPFEIDQLKESKNFRMEKRFDGTSVLWVYQSKLASVPFRYRWKLIPLIFPEQKKIPKILQRKRFSRPLVKTVRRYFGKDTSLYGGRKGFTDLMMSRDQRIEHVSQWMGHSTIQRTWQHYKDRRIVHYKREMP